MIARLLKLLLALQALAVLCLALPAWQALPSNLDGWPRLGLALLLALSLVLAGRLLITAQNFILSFLFRSPTPLAHRVSPWQRCRLFIDEFAATMQTSSAGMVWPGPNWFLAAGDRHTPVLLLHGYACNHGYWNQLARLLTRAGISHYGPDLTPPGASIEEFAAQLGPAVEALCQASGQPRVIIVAHSMGGLVARAYLRRCGSARVARVITLATPHHGTGLANFALGRNALQMRRSGRRPDATGSAWLTELAASEPAATRALFTSVFSHHDNIVAPQTSGCLPGARNIEFGAIGHVASGRHPAMLACLMDEIALARSVSFYPHRARRGKRSAMDSGAYSR